MRKEILASLPHRTWYFLGWNVGDLTKILGTLVNVAC